jgi:tetratricopeptide (TPR) repeat protein
VLDRGDGLHSIHELQQVSVRTQDQATSNPWSRDEWRTAERRLVEHWSTQFQSDSSTLWSDRRRQSLAFWQLATLYATTDVDAEVLADVIMLVQLHGVWATLDAARNQPDELVNERGGALLRVLDGVLARQIGNLAECDAVLSEALAMPTLTGNLRRLAQYYLAETRDIHEGDATSLFQTLAEIDDRIGTEARLAHAHSLTRTGDLATALRIAQGFDAQDPDPEFGYRIHELLGVVWLFAGRFETAAEHFATSRQVGEAVGSPLLAALGARHLCLALCWSDPQRASELLDEAETLNRDLNLPPGIGQCLMARAVCQMASARPDLGIDRIDDVLADAEATFRRAGYLDDALGPVALRVLAAATVGDQELASQRRTALVAQAEGRRARTWLAAADVWTGNRAWFDRIRWPQGADAAYRDWRAVLSRT